jgi:hypothetical protein
MVIKRRIDELEVNELPIVKFYLDDVRDIVEILTPLTEGHGEISIRFFTESSQCDSLEELGQIGGRTSSLDIQVGHGPFDSTVRIKSYGSHLYLHGDELARGNATNKIRTIFAANTVWWKNALRNLPLWTAFIPSVAFVGMMVLFYTYAPHEHAARRMFEIICFGGWFILSSILIFHRPRSVVILRYAHTQGFRRWLDEHGTQLGFLVLGSALGYVFKFVTDWLAKGFGH